MGKPTARMRAQKPCGPYCKSSNHLHLEPQYADDVEVMLVGAHGVYGDQYLHISLGDRWFTVDHEELIALAKAVVTEKPKGRKR